MSREDRLPCCSAATRGQLAGRATHRENPSASCSANTNTGPASAAACHTTAAPFAEICIGPARLKLVGVGGGAVDVIPQSPLADL